MQNKILFEIIQKSDLYIIYHLFAAYFSLNSFKRHHYSIDQSSKKMQKQKQTINKNNQKSQEANAIKKVIIVIGKMGHGKSSFIKMLVTEEDKPKVKTGSQTASVTNTCDLYQMSRKAKISLNIELDQPIYILDTPGINSKQRNYLIIEQIRKILLIHKCEIIAIAYLKNSNDFRQDQKCSYAEFHKVFPIKRPIKQKISFFIFSHVDQQIYAMNTFEQGKKSLKELFLNQGIQFKNKKQVNWISQNQQEKQQFIAVKQSKIGNKILQNQWKDLGSNLKNINENKCSFEDFQKGILEYQTKFKFEMSKTMKNLNQFVRDKINLEFEFNQVYDIDKKLVNIGFLFQSLGVTGIAGIFGYLLKTTQLANNPYLAMTGLALPAVIASLGHGLIRVGDKYYKSKMQQRINNVCNFQQNTINPLINSLESGQKQELGKLNVQSIKFQCIQDMFSIKDQKCLILKKGELIEQISVKKRKFKQKSMNFQDAALAQDKITIQNKQIITIFKLSLEEGSQYLFEIKIKRPTQNVLHNISVKIALDTYFNDQQKQQK